MAEWSVPVDLLNPGHVFACRGLVEGAETFLGTDFVSHFAYEPGATRARFVIEGVASSNPIVAVIEFLRRATASLVVPSPASEPQLFAKQVPSSTVTQEYEFPMRVPKTSASLPALLSDGTRNIQLDSWSDGPNQLERDNVKFWGGSGGKTGAELAHNALALVADMSHTAAEASILDPFEFSAPMSGSFRFDWRRDYVPLDSGFSPNDHADVTMLGFPLTELLAAIGLQHARPRRTDPRNKLSYRYGISSTPLPTILARPILGALDIGFPMRTFQMTLGWPGKENQARCIIDAREEVQP